MDQEESFTSVVKIAGINLYVDVPEQVIKALGGGKKAAVLVKIAATSPEKDQALAVQRKGKLEKNATRLKAISRLASGDWFCTTLIPLQLEPTRLYLDMWMRESAGIDVGDHAILTLKLDLNPREIPLPGTLREALEANTKARGAWEALAPSRQREILTYLNFLKTPEAVERNVQKVIANLVEQ